jgi:hypothetical protein
MVCECATTSRRPTSSATLKGRWASLYPETLRPYDFSPILKFKFNLYKSVCFCRHYGRLQSPGRRRYCAVTKTIYYYYTIGPRIIGRFEGEVEGAVRGEMLPPHRSLLG